MTDEELALVTRLEGYRTTCCDDSRTVPDLIAIIRRLESEVAALKESIRERERKAFESGAAFVNVQLLEVQDQMPPYRISEAFADWEREK